ncbi:sugar fermentation stimulation protein [Thalassobacillus devorans]|uniref:Sugar fermentation stimulation protein homolog n=1 Tax=Thalassobacillus devorans TaxID=279813 RepID=A0ABQ1P0D2_9BACI|nr:DNA/RNA nuclease SfsA [Thalassobacillus devorans]NIK28182.1 sugar fermentation stimulation protein A [Thalassobacillus devorans]GGC88249.1 sugar fermentation stimulation protein [Thalassobacillus devorans]
MQPALVPFEQDKLFEAVFLERPNRFILHCRLKENGQTIRVYLPDPGRLTGLLREGAAIIVRNHDDPNRKTAWSAVMVEDTSTNTMVSLNTQLANQLVEKALRSGVVPSLKNYQLLKREYTMGHSRFDFLLYNGNRKLILEVKSVTMREDTYGKFPDAVTKRGKKHVEELAQIQREGKMDTAILFVAQRNDLTAITTAEEIDPAFSTAVKQAEDYGVKVLGSKCTVDWTGIRYDKEVPFHYAKNNS